MQRVKAKTAFNSTHDNALVFTTEKKTSARRKQMNKLGGDTYFNRWKVPLVPLAQLTHCVVATYKKLGDPQSHAGTVDMPGDGHTVDDLGLGDDVRISFPRNLTCYCVKK